MIDEAKLERARRIARTVIDLGRLATNGEEVLRRLGLPDAETAALIAELRAKKADA